MDTSKGWGMNLENSLKDIIINFELVEDILYGY